jgi:hypothetical protein
VYAAREPLRALRPPTVPLAAQEFVRHGHKVGRIAREVAALAPISQTATKVTRVALVGDRKDHARVLCAGADDASVERVQHVVLAILDIDRFHIGSGYEERGVDTRQGILAEHKDGSGLLRHERIVTHAATRRAIAFAWSQQACPADDHRDMTAGGWIRSARRTRGVACLWAGQAAFWVAMGVGVTVAVVTAQDASWQDIVGGVAIGLVAVALGVGMSVYARGCLRAGLRIGPDAVVVANPLSRRVVKLSEIEGFSAGLQSLGYGNPTPGILLDLVDGSHVRVWALAREGLVWNEARNRSHWVPTAERLNALFASLR